jgi:2-polyprenyl-3-methyl-5-hydroxy-6-metoxy-1,4-benzoquinol methylase
LRIVERPIPTYYGDEICRVNGLKYAWNVAPSSRVVDLGCAGGYLAALLKQRKGCLSRHRQVEDRIA